MTQAEQQIDVGGPRPDAVQGDERRMRLVGRHGAERVEIDVARWRRALPISRIDLILAADRPSRLSLSVRARRTVS